ncbi:MAG: hypothetical protein QHI48_09615 [Bacteroidota bacterium]|nr:hypothetical protein [Bacteroidota bacterium]
MNARPITIFLAVVWIFTAMSRVQAQQGTIEESWNRAAREKKSTPPAGSVSERRVGSEESTLPRWGYRESEGAVDEQTRWLTMTRSALPADFYAANKKLIDSLAVLFCLPSGYIRSLTARNEAARSPVPAPQRPDFSYQRPETTPYDEKKGALEALNRELLILLHQCLYGD